VLAAWLAIMIALPFVGPTNRQVAIIGDGARAAKAITAAGGEIVERRRGATLARARGDGFVAALYHNGATLVIEGRIAAGCFSPAVAR
jgi:hypothetical protein